MGVCSCVDGVQVLGGEYVNVLDPVDPTMVVPVQGGNAVPFSLEMLTCVASDRRFWWSRIDCW